MRSLWSITVAVRSKTQVYGRWFAGIAGSNPAEAWLFSCICCVIYKQWSLQRAVHSLRGALWRARVCVIYKPKNEATWARVRLLRHKRITIDHHKVDVNGSFLSITFVLITEVADRTVFAHYCVFYFSETTVALCLIFYCSLIKTEG